MAAAHACGCCRAQMSIPYSIGIHTVYHRPPRLTYVLPDCSIICMNCWGLKQQPTCTICHAKCLWPCAAAEAFASQADMESSAVTFDYDPDYVDRKYELLSLKVIHRRRRTGFEETKDFPIRVNDLVAGRYQVS